MADSTIEMDAPERTAESLPDGDYAIVELFGHTTLVGRVSEVERFGSKMLALEPLFNGTLMDAVLHGGAAIYRLTPCSPQIAWERQPRDLWQLPPAIRVVVPPAALPSPEPAPERDYEQSERDDSEEVIF